MQRTTLLLTALLVFAAATPFAAAQDQFSTTTTEVALDGTDHPLKPGTQVATPGKVVYTYPGNGQMELSGTTITFKVAEKPDWATVVVTPKSVVIPVSGMDPAPTITKWAKFQVQVHVSDDAPLGDSAVLRIQAVASQNGQLAGSVGEAEMLLAVTSDDPCTASASGDEVSIQGVTAEPAGFLGLAPAQMIALLGLGGTAAAVGVALGRGLKRKDA